MKRITIVATMALLFTVTASLLARDPAPRVVTSDEVLFTGFVIDDASGGPIADANVWLEGSAAGSVTDRDGEYAFRVARSQLSAAAARLLVRRDGFAESAAEIAIDRETIRTHFRLKSSESRTIQETAPRNGPMAVRSEVAVDAQAAPMVRSAIGAVADLSVRDPSVANLAPPPDWNRESYAHIVENAFQSVQSNPLSTFSIDVDRASYSNVRRFLLDRRLPPTDAVRIEEMVNYFPYDYPRPEAGGVHPFSVSTEIAPAPWRAGHKLLRISLASAPVETDHLPPSNLVFLLDVSGSMNSPAKLPLVKRSMRMLVNELRPEDRVAIVVYAGAAGLVLPSTFAEERSRILGAIEALEAGGSTAGGAGLQLAYRVARENHIEGGNNRVILATDGDFNVGQSSDSEMIRLIERMRDQGTFLTVLGFGTGNLQDAKMEQIADYGNGNYAYIDSFLEARKVLVSEIGGTLLTVAKDVKLQVEFNPATVRGYRLIGYENRLLAAEDFNDDTRDAGELGAGHTVTALYEIVPVESSGDVEIRGTDPLRYQTAPAANAPANGELAYVRVRYKPPTSDTSRLLEEPVRDRTGTASNDLRFASAVAGFGMLLRESEHRGSMTISDLIALARDAVGRDEAGYRGEFVELLGVYRSLIRD
jgi:Ca-activated chloride channel family protein